MADQVPVVRVSRQYHRTRQLRLGWAVPTQVTLRGKLLYCACIVATLGWISLALSLLWRGLSWGEAFPLALASSVPYLIGFVIRDPLGWRRGMRVQKGEGS